MGVYSLPWFENSKARIFEFHSPSLRIKRAHKALHKKSRLVPGLATCVSAAAISPALPERDSSCKPRLHNLSHETTSICLKPKLHKNSTGEGCSSFSGIEIFPSSRFVRNCNQYTIFTFRNTRERFFPKSHQSQGTRSRRSTDTPADSPRARIRRCPRDDTT